MSTKYSIGQMNQLGDALEAAEFTVDEVTKLRSFSDLAALRSVVNGLGKIVVAKLLSKVTSVPVNGAKKFVLTEDILKKANVSFMGDTFKRLFFGKVEENVSGATLSVDCLENPSSDAPIRTELGDRANIFLAYFFELLIRQSKGEDGVLLTNDCANVAYIEGNDGEVWAVDANWFSGYGVWSVNASSVENPSEWRVGIQVLSRDS